MRIKTINTVTNGGMLHQPGETIEVSPEVGIRLCALGAALEVIEGVTPPRIVPTPPATITPRAARTGGRARLESDKLSE